MDSCKDARRGLEIHVCATRRRVPETSFEFGVGAAGDYDFGLGIRAARVYLFLERVGLGVWPCFLLTSSIMNLATLAKFKI